MKNKSDHKNIKKKLASIVLYTMLVVITIPIAITLLFQSPAVQTITAKFATKILSNSIGNEVNISTIRLSFFSGINIKGFKVNDHHDNTLLSISNLSATPVFSDFSFSNIKFSNVNFDNLLFNMGTYKGDSLNNLSTLLNKLLDNTKSGGTFKLFSKNVKITDSHFNLFDQNKNYNTGDNSIDYSNIIIDSIYIDARDFVLINDSLNFKAINLSAKEESGVIIKKLSADVIISSKGIYTNNTILHMNNSNINADFGMEYSSYSTFRYYIDSVNMIVDVRPTMIDMADIGFFAEVLFEMPNMVGLSGKMTGTVSDLIGKNIKIKYGKDTRVSGNLRFTGLPDFYTTYITGDDLFIITNTEDINNFNLPIEEKQLDFSNILSYGEQITAKGDFSGYFKDFTSNIELSLSYGKIKSDIKFKQLSNNLTSFNLSVVGDSFNIGAFLDQSILGNMSFDIKLSGNSTTPKSIKYNLSGILTNVDLIDYNYRRISIDGNYHNDSIIAKLRVGDKNLMMSASGTAHLTKSPTFMLNSNIVSANLNKLNLWHDQNINISSQLKAKVKGADINTLNADISLTNNNISFDENEYVIDSIVLTKSDDSLGITDIVLNSDLVNANLKGDYNISTLPQSTYGLINNYFNIMPTDKSYISTDDNYASINVNLLKPRLLGNEFLSGVRFSKGTRLSGELNFNKKNVQLNLSSNKIKIGDIILDSCAFNSFTSGDSLICEFAIADVILKDSTPDDSLVFGMDNLSFSTKIQNDSIIYGLNWNNRNQSLKNSGQIEGYLSHTVDTTKFSIGEANVFINDILWNINANNLVVMTDNRVFFQNIYINAGKSEFKLIGTIPKYDNDSLVVNFTNWNLSTFDIVTTPFNIDLDGEINGKLSFSLIKDNPTVVSNISIKDMMLNKEYLGDAHIINNWDHTNNSIFIKSNIIRQGNAGKGEVFTANGYYFPFKKEDNLNIDIKFNRIKLKIIEPFVSKLVRDVEGTTSGKLAIRGSALQPIVTGSADMMRTSMRVVYLNTKYSFSNSLEFVKNGIKFDKLVIYDTLGNQADINGKLTYDYFKNPKFDISIITSKLLFFNTTRDMNKLYYGSAIASGKIKILGSPDDIDLNIDVKTKEGTSVILPLEYSVEISDKDYIIFIKPSIDSITENIVINEAEINKKEKINFNIDVKMEVSPVAKIDILLPDDMGSIEARGNSNLALGVNSKGKFSLIGDYIIDDGLFHFKIGNLVNKRFRLVNGGKISWTGNPYSANVNIKGLYKVKTSLSSLGVEIDTTASYKNKVTVECYVVLTNELLNPTIKFEIKIPELDPDLQRLVFSELDTTNTALMNQQMISLLVLGTFSFNNSANVSFQSSYYNVIANQLSNMLSQISDNVDIGLNYKPGDNVTQEEFEVALSTQLFNNRLIIDGNFGMTYDRSHQSASNIVGDVDIGYKLTPDGQWILKVFNHSNVNSWYNYNNYDQVSPYTQGIGIAFVRNFNHISELFQSRKKSEKKKKENIINSNNKLKEDEDEAFN